MVDLRLIAPGVSALGDGRWYAMRLSIYNKLTNASEVRDVPGDEVSIGSDPANAVALEQSTLSPRHARIVIQNGQVIVEDLQSTRGTFIGLDRVREPTAVRPGEKLTMGEFIVIPLGPSSPGGNGAGPEREPSPPPAVVRQEAVRRESRGGAEAGESRALQRRRSAMRDESIIKLKRDIHNRLIEFLDLKRMDFGKIDDEELRVATKKALQDIIKILSYQIPHDLDRNKLIKEILDETLGLGPIEDLLRDTTVSEIMVNNMDQVYVERNGRLELTETYFSSNESVLAIIERIVAPLGRRIDESSPLVDARLPDGSRVNAIIPPLALTGPCLTIRKFSKEPFTAQQLITFGSLTPESAEFLEVAVKSRANIAISGGTASGKTTLLNCLCYWIPETERIITIEDAAELQLPQEHLITLESRAANIQGKGEISIQRLVINALRMRPDRIVVGECRGGEALDMLQAMNTG
ncbi:MAG: Flp pilus assembly complex ATPase component TadA, partial [Myxococcales bacterium]|nr:Flp pilus assembly complex ATPase component TadA [Myxococcales bacterium]